MKGIFLALALCFLFSSFLHSQTNVYYEDFSNNPDFTSDYTTGGDEFFTWDSNDSTYKIRIVEQHNIEKYAFSPVFDSVSNHSFTLNIDLNIVQSSFGMPIGIRFLKNNITPNFQIIFRGPQDPNYAISDGNGNQYFTSNVNYGTWYSLKIKYFNSTQTANIILKTRETGETTYSNINVPFIPY